MLLTSGWIQLLLVLLGIVALVATLWAIFSDTFNRGEKAVAVIPSLVLVLSASGVLWGQTHIVVRPNQYVLVIDRQTGEPIIPLRGAGVTEVPLWTWTRYEYPAQKDYQWCPTFTPSSKNGASLTVVVCFTTDASAIDWTAQFRSFNGDQDVVMAGWQNAVQTDVASAFSKFDPRDLTNKRSDVETGIFQATFEWFKSHGISVTMVGLKNWQFASQAINDAYDQAQLSQTKVDVANAEKAAAQVEQETALIRAETQVKVVTTLAAGQRAACNTAGMVSETACLEYLQLVWLSQGGIDPSVVVITGGGDAAPVIALPAENVPANSPTQSP
ncbi:hypothetical protein A3A84_02010 [Candidatus Collierbacteria bacterium RIFCSPLOWO2_01_FULL_50_23]|uniref:Band 7 domain-containing protein n=2 Tax=Candidatus Collieribacteriota TaxID=1752725 RepID=A0A1F5EQZ9_9BACT|nr:MAG: hypothetical protein A3D09_02535 [Candidatus Collierbacteria bacterium RIFCSPHIGHO2_02_FULL_49_10]OGD71228.1 MAG: hypothetical protein A2703_02630 [Candidatus Collierbacteria bacterium RIFCSPHIGHO2_01_FULL_50_25]OGD73741.1 MAG: hypothetical protein A3A84_02010 [Candidatus Collierbacteria bacterium RIFCSPLOWO2_01_FULL_50_23]